MKTVAIVCLQCVCTVPAVCQQCSYSVPTVFLQCVYSVVLGQRAARSSGLCEFTQSIPSAWASL